METGHEIDLFVHDALTSAGAPALCRSVLEALAARPGRVWLNLEDVKVTDVAGLAALLQAVRRAESHGVPLTVLPSPTVYRALLTAGLLDDVPLEGSRPDRGLAELPAGPAPGLTAPPWLARTERLLLRPPAWDELEIFERWANDPLLDQMVGSPLLYLCRHVRAHHPDFVARVLHDATALTLLVQPVGDSAEPVGFVRFHGVSLGEGFAFLETAVTGVRGLRAGWGVEASRLALAYAMDALEIRRVEAKVYAYNVLSINALRRNGFRLEGRLREARTYGGQRWDILVFAILEGEMRAQRARERFPYMGFWPPDARP
ncbi:MAG: GNAT family N-acetyltransferase [Candidatus Rokubacteria bacterium]|nr:GNAT family N-acetyltransferase [Candidatus Rokubacteria bacterium]MBI2491188.1 GNAT family N-acetyltransferase [Candidatus Rokubacteria bacterium]